MKLDYNSLPAELREYHLPEAIHKITKQGKTVITIHTKNRRQYNWEKVNQTWTLISEKQI